MLQSIVIMLKSTSRVVRRIDVNALHLPGELLFQRLESEQIVPADEPVVEEVPVRNPVLRVMGLVRLLQQDARLQLRPVLLADPGGFEFGFLGRHGR
jgi:hypothetical protein